MNLLGNKKSQLLLDQCLFSGTNFLINLGLIKVLDLGQYGLFATLTMALYLLLSMAHALVMQPMQVNLAKISNPNAYKVSLLILTAIIASIFTLVVGLIYLCHIETLSELMDYLWPFSIYVILFVLFDFLRKYFLAIDHILKSIIMSSLYLITISIAYLFSQLIDQGELIFFIWILILAFVPSLVVALYYYTDRLELPSHYEIRDFIKIHLVEGQWLLYGSIIQWLSSNLYVLTSGFLISAQALGVLRFVQTIFGIINILLQTVENYFLPYLSKIYAFSVQEFYSTFQRNAGKLQALLFIGLSLMYIFSKEVILFLGNSEFGPYHFVLRGMVILYIIIIAGYPIRLLIRITELNKSYFAAYMASFIISLLTYQYLLKEYGESGAIIGLIINQIILQATWLVALYKKQINLWKLYI